MATRTIGTACVIKKVMTHRKFPKRVPEGTVRILLKDSRLRDDEHQARWVRMSETDYANLQQLIRLH